MASKPDKIELFIGSVRQLFNSFDPSPFLERDLDAEAERYIVAWAAELDAKKPIVLLVHFSGSPDDSPDSNFIPGALSNYFDYRANQAKWPAAGFTDTELRCFDGTGGFKWREGSSAASSSLRR